MKNIIGTTARGDAPSNIVASIGTTIHSKLMSICHSRAAYVPRCPNPWTFYNYSIDFVTHLACANRRYTFGDVHLGQSCRLQKAVDDSKSLSTLFVMRFARPRWATMEKSIGSFFISATSQVQLTAYTAVVVLT